jgi:hypothetical protein
MERGTLGESAAKTDPIDNAFCRAELVARIVAQFRTDPARIMPNCPNQYLPKRLKTFNPISSDTFSRPPVSTTHPRLHFKLYDSRSHSRKPCRLFGIQSTESRVFYSREATSVGRKYF